MFEHARVGDKVWSFSFGDGRISTISLGTLNPVIVKFNHGYSSYRYDGCRTNINIRPDLYWHSFEVPDTAYALPKVPKYQWLLKDEAGEYMLTADHYADEKEVRLMFKDVLVIRHIPETKVFGICIIKTEDA